MEGSNINKYRKYIVIGLLAIIILMSIYVYSHRNSLFTNRAEIVYSDGCKEVYEDTVLVTPICENGRAQEYTNSNNGNDRWKTGITINSTLINLT